MAPTSSSTLKSINTLGDQGFISMSIIITMSTGDDFSYIRVKDAKANIIIIGVYT